MGAYHLADTLKKDVPLRQSGMMYEKPPQGTYKAYKIPQEVMTRYYINEPLFIVFGRSKHHRNGPDSTIYAATKRYGSFTIATKKNHAHYQDIEMDNVQWYEKQDFLFLSYFLRCEPSFVGISLKTIASRLLNKTGFTYHTQKNYQKAAAHFSKAFTVDTNFAQAAFNHACAQALLGNTDKALQALRQAIRTRPTKFKKKARKDKDLKSLYENKEFQEIIR